MGKDSSSSDKSPFAELVEIMARLRSPEGCPWDRKQDHRSLRPCLLEETYEVLEAVDRDDPQALCQELGDLLLQVIFHAQLATEAGQFDMDDVVKGLRDKLVARHPHVFGDSAAETPEEVLHQWDDLKRRERGEGEESTSPMTDVPKTLPALSRAHVVERRAARAGRGRPVEDVCSSACAALGVLTGQKLDPQEAQKVIGELLLAAVDLARIAGLDAEQVLRERVDERISELSDPADSPDAPAGGGRD
jgi:tetrapyrrole methylase family protein/MazG family protein